MDRYLSNPIARTKFWYERIHRTIHKIKFGITAEPIRKYICKKKEDVIYEIKITHNATKKVTHLKLVSNNFDIPTEKLSHEEKAWLRKCQDVYD